MTDSEAVSAVLARYVRAADRRDGAAMAALFMPEGRVDIVIRAGGGVEPLGSLAGRAAIEAAVATMMKPHGPGGWSHHTTHDHLAEINGDSALLDAQFVVFEVRAAEVGARGSIAPIEAGYYRLALRREPSGWLIESNRIEHDFPPG